MIFVDSSVWIDYFNGTATTAADALDGLLGREPLVLGDIVLAEVLQGFRRDRDYQIAIRLFRGFEVRPVVGEAIALKSAANFRALRRRGITVRKTIDALIATYCIENKLLLLHSDQDFRPFGHFLGLREVL